MFAVLLLITLASGCTKSRDPILGGDGLAAQPPTVTAVTPLNGAVGVSIGSPAITATFSEPVLMNPGGSTFTVSSAAPGVTPTGTVTFDAANRVASFALPSGTSLSPFTLYTGTVSGFSSRASGLALAIPYVWTFTTGAAPDTTRPRVTLTVPATTVPGPTLGVSTTATISASFSEDMAAATLIPANFTITGPSAAPVSGSVSYASRTAVFTPSAALAADTTYTVTITTGATDLAGNGLAGNQAALPAASNYVWTFTTSATPDTTRPRVTLTTPATTIPGRIDVPTNTAIAAAFTEDMNPATLTAASFTVVGPNGIAVAGTVAYTSRTAIFTAPAGLAPSTTYTATITQAATDLVGNALAGNQALLPAASNYVWTFATTAAADTTRPQVTLTVPTTTTPGPTAGVPINTAIAAAFTKDMNPLTFTAATFLVTGPGGVPVVGTVSYGSRTAVFSAPAGLASNTTYTATITQSVTDLAGNALAGNQAPLPAASNYLWTFTTMAAPDTTRPQVTLTVPSTTIPGPTLGVATNTAIAAAFTKDMNPATITAATFTVTGPGGVSLVGTVAYTSRTAIFTAPAGLAPSTTYTATITKVATDLAGNALAGNQAPLPAASNYVWTFTTAAAPDTTRPQVTLTVPVTTIPGRTDVPTNTAIAAAFTKDMNPSTLNVASFTVIGPGGLPLVGTVTYTSRTAVFTAPAGLAPSTTYTATITQAATDLAGNALAGNQAPLPAASNYVWTFTTAAAPDTTRPRVTLTVPATTIPGPTTGVAINTAIAAAFTKDMNPSTLNVASFTVTGPAGVPVVGTVAYTSRTAIFTAPAGLASSTTYTATITQAAADLAGNALAGNQAPFPAASNYVWTFTTAAAPDTTPPQVTLTVPATTNPGPTAAVPINTAVSAAFTKEMNPLTLTAATFTLTGPGGVPVVGSVTYASRTALFTPTSGLAGLTTYIATVTLAAKDLAGNPLAGNQAPFPAASNYVWSFTTGPAPDTTRPQVLVTAPATTIPGPTPGVDPSTAIFAVFTEVMNPSTINTSTFTVVGSDGISLVGLGYYSDRTAVFASTANLAPFTTYTATITKAATDLAGNALAGNQAPLPAASDYVWTFTTGSVATLPTHITVLTTNPVAGGTGVCPSATVNASFSVPSGVRLDPATVNAATFTLTGPGLTPVTAASVTLDAPTGRIATFTPLVALTNGVLYTATLKSGPTGVKDLAAPANTLLSDYTWTFTAGPATGACLTPPALLTASVYGVFGGTGGMTNTGTLTVINGDIGTIATGTSAITGFHDPAGDIFTESPANIGAVNGTIYTCTNSTTGPTSGGVNAAYCTVATQARLDAQAAYLALVAMPVGFVAPGNLAGQTLAPGVYAPPAGSFLIQGGNLTLDAQGNANAVWVFKMATSLTVGGPGASFPQSVILINGAQSKNVFWQVGSAATINAAGGGTMVGTIIAQAGIAFSTAGNVTPVILNGRALSLGASVTLVDTVINVPAP